MKKNFILFVLIISAINSFAFEGELHYRSMVNADEFMIAASKGLIFNGVRNQTVLIKGNKTLITDNTQYCQLYDGDNGKIVLYSLACKKGLRFDYEFYRNFMATWSRDKRIIRINKKISVELSPTAYKIEERQLSEKYEDHNMKAYKVLIEHDNNNDNFDIYCIDQQMPSSYYDALYHGLSIDGDKLIVKFVLHSLMKLPKLDCITGAIAKKLIRKKIEAKFNNQPKMYECAELKKITARDVSDEEFSIPNEILIKDSEDIVDLHNILTEHWHVLQKSNFQLEQKQIEYEINEDWDF